MNITGPKNTPSEEVFCASRIPLSEPTLGGNEWEYLKECLDTNWVSSAGPFVRRFEDAVASYVGARYAVAVSSGTAAIHTALMVAGVGPDDEVLVSSMSFIASANAIRYTGAHPVFVDAEPEHWQIDVERVREFLEKDCTHLGRVVRNRRTGRRVAAVLPVHILGHPCEMSSLLEVCRRFELPVVEDATESLGASCDGSPLGCQGDVGCFSFNGNKLVTAGGGGMITTSREDWAERALYLATQAKDAGEEYSHADIGFNYRLTNLQAAVGLAQFEEIDKKLAAKRQLARRYTQAFQGVQGLNLMREAPWASSAWWLYTVLLDRSVLQTDVRAVRSCLSSSGIEARRLWQPLHESLAHKESQVLGGQVAERIYAEALSLPSSVGLGASQQDQVINAVLAALTG